MVKINFGIKWGRGFLWGGMESEFNGFYLLVKVSGEGIVKIWNCYRFLKESLIF